MTQTAWQWYINIHATSNNNKPNTMHVNFLGRFIGFIYCKASSSPLIEENQSAQNQKLSMAINTTRIQHTYSKPHLHWNPLVNMNRAKSSWTINFKSRYLMHFSTILHDSSCITTSKARSTRNMAWLREKGESKSYLDLKKLEMQWLFGCLSLKQIFFMVQNDGCLK